MILHKSLTINVGGWCSVIGATHQYEVLEDLVYTRRPNSER